MIPLLLACASPPTDPPPSAVGHVFAPAASDAEGTYALTAIRSEYRSAGDSSTTVNLELTLDAGAARLCAVRESHDSPHGKPPTTLRTERAFRGRYATDGAAVLLELAPIAAGCDSDLDGSANAHRERIPCTLGNLDRHRTLACPVTEYLGGDDVSLPIGLARELVYLGRDTLTMARTDYAILQPTEFPEWTLIW